MRCIDAQVRERGWALVSVLWIVAMLTMMAAATQALTVTSYKIEHRVMERASIGAALDAGIVRAVMGIGDADAPHRWRVDGEPKNFAFGGYDMRIAVQDQLGCIDLNAVDESLLRALLVSAGVSNDEALSITDRILDWRSLPSLHHLHGATDEDYVASGYTYHQRHGPFQTVDELKLVMGMTPAVFARIRPALTVYTQRPMIDPNVAPRAVLLALHANDDDAVEEILRARSATGASSTIGSGISLAGHTFGIAVKIETGRRRFERDAVVELTGDSKRPYFVLWWR